MNKQYQMITDADALRRAVAVLAAQTVIGFDTETTALSPFDGRVRLIQLASTENVFIIDLDAFRATANQDGANKNSSDNLNSDDNLKSAEALKPLRELLSAARPVKVAHNMKFDAKWMRVALGVEVEGIFDTLLASQIVSAGVDERHGLEIVAARYINQTLDKSAQLSDWSGELSEMQLDYAARDAQVLLPLREALIARLKAEDLIRVAQIEFDCVIPIAVLELNGFYLDAARWREQLAVVEKRRARLAEELQAMLSVGTVQGSLFENVRQEVNIDSHTQLTAALKRLNVPVPDSTRNWKLQPLAAEFPVVAKLLEYRTTQKALTSYGANILESINPKTGRVHADFIQIGAPTGRMACRNPNIQQVPNEYEYRRCFRAPAGRKLIIADYSQVELRILADVTGDTGFIEAFNTGADLHRVTSAQVFGVKPEDVTAEQRSFAKRLNFGVVYGIGANRFSAMTGLKLSEAEDIMRRYFATYTNLQKWLRDAATTATRERQARTMTGRLARFTFDSADKQAASLAQRNGKNMPIQGAAADIFKRAMRLLHNDLRKTSACIVNLVHDEIVVEADAKNAEEIADVVKRAMCAAGAEYIKRVPIEVEAHVADEWTK